MSNEGGRLAVHMYTQPDGAYELRIAVPREERAETVTVLKEAGVERPLDQLQEGPITAFSTVVASVAGALGLKKVLVALVQVNQGKEVKFTTKDKKTVRVKGYSKDDVIDILRELGINGASGSSEEKGAEPSPSP